MHFAELLGRWRAIPSGPSQPGKSRADAPRKRADSTGLTAAPASRTVPVGASCAHAKCISSLFCGVLLLVGLAAELLTGRGHGPEFERRAARGAKGTVPYPLESRLTGGFLGPRVQQKSSRSHSAAAETPRFGLGYSLTIT